MSEVYQIAIVEDEPNARERLVRIVDGLDGCNLVGAADSVAGGLELLTSKTPTIVLCDLGLPDGDGAQVIAKATSLGILSLVISVFGDEENVIRAIENGACGYLLKDSDSTTVRDAVLEVIGGGAPITPSIARHLLKRLQKPVTTENDLTESSEDAPALTHRETEVLDLVSRGFKFSEIAKFLSISPHTVGNHIRKVYKKLNVSSRTEAVFEAVQWGIISIKE